MDVNVKRFFVVFQGNSVGEGGVFFRSAGACPPRSLGWRRGRFFIVTRGLSAALVAWRGTGPRPTVRGGAFCCRIAGALGCHTRIRAGFPSDRCRKPFFFVARGPVPRDRWITRGSRFFIGAGGLSFAIAAWRGTGPRPTVRGEAFFYRIAGACPPRSLQETVFFRSVGACPPRSLVCAREPFFS